MRITTPPDFFELRLDALPDIDENTAAALAAPIIATARHPAEGGAQNLPANQRRALLERFADVAEYVDIELRSAQSFRSLLHRRKIISSHDFEGTPSLSSLREKLGAARALGADVFKIATRVDEAGQLTRLIRFFDEASPLMPISAMGIGALGRKSRIELARRGSVLNYGCITAAQAPGQLSVAELRRLLGR